ncbi:hypothetical protein SAMN04488030_1409 [Aliiroseovarius halocynthiae]|nr:hypothetical protein SAMN04488030_1409 [Aliiroseovarius halocynthiae]
MVVPGNIDGFDARPGIFCAAYELKYRNDVDKISLEILLDLLGWFEEYLDAPDKFSRKKNDSHSDFTRGLSWFKPSATVYVQKMWQLKTLLGEWDYPVEVLKTRRPGRIIYEDNVQVVADPFSDTPR